MYLPIIGAFLEAAGMILEKRVLKSRKLDYRNYTVFGFLGILLVMAPFLYWIWRIDSSFWNVWPMLTFSFVVITALAANLLIFYSLKRENIGEFEPLWLMQPLFTILLAVILYKSERQWSIVLLALIASLSLLLMHVKKHHLYFDKYMWAGLFGNFLFAVELTFSKNILPYFSSFTFYFTRCFLILIICWAIYRPSFKVVDRKISFYVLLIGVMWVLFRLILYFGYGAFGIVYTTIIFILSPVLMLLFAAIFLKEKLTKRQIITNVIILICVVLAISMSRT